ncbi:hypothetical protein [Solibacillus sp. CAU 1738]|uniref:hypothetical protein n=1 Tax=Solibacillus sp. CAU 1738 TaxID=3140363 RepID=UPI0032614798
MRKWQWAIAFVICVIVWGTTLVPDNKATKVIERVVYSQDDLTFMRNAIRTVFVSKDRQIEVAAYPGAKELLSFVSVQPNGKGYLLTFEQAIRIFALQNGIVVFTGHTKQTGKTISIYYDDDTTVTYGYVDHFSLLPYTAVGIGEVLATKQSGELYIEIEQRGVILNLEQTLKWLKEHV